MNVLKQRTGSRDGHEVPGPVNVRETASFCIYCSDATLLRGISPTGLVPRVRLAEGNVRSCINASWYPDASRMQQGSGCSRGHRMQQGSGLAGS